MGRKKGKPTGGVRSDDGGATSGSSVTGGGGVAATGPKLGRREARKAARVAKKQARALFTAQAAARRQKRQQHAQHRATGAGQSSTAKDAASGGGGGGSGSAQARPAAVTHSSGSRGKRERSDAGPSASSTRGTKRRRGAVGGAAVAPPQPSREAAAAGVAEQEEEDPEDAEIRRLEAKLGIRKSRGKRGSSGGGEPNWEKVRKEYEEDGFGSDFVDFLSRMDAVAAGKSAARKAKKAARQAAKEARREERRARKAARREAREARRAQRAAAAGATAQGGGEPDPEDAEIRRLEKKLGITSKGAKANSKGAGPAGSGGHMEKLRKEFAEDGFGEDFVDFLGRLDKLASGGTASSRSRSSTKSRGAAANDTTPNGAGGRDGKGTAQRGDDGAGSDASSDTEESDGELPAWMRRGVDGGDGDGDERSSSQAGSDVSEGYTDLKVDETADLDTLPGVTVTPNPLAEFMQQLAALHAADGESDSDSDEGMAAAPSGSTASEGDDSGDESGEDSESSSDSDSSQSSSGSDDDGASSGSEDEAAAAERRARAAEAAARRKSKQQLLYGENETEIAEVTTATPGLYVPPHLRKARNGGSAGAATRAQSGAAHAAGSAGVGVQDGNAGAGPGAGASAAAVARRAQLRKLATEGTPEEARRLRRRVQGVFNRLTEANVEPMVKELAALYQDPTNSVRVLTTVVTNLLLECASNEHQVLRALLMVQSVVVAAIHMSIGPEVGAQVLENVAERLQTLLALTPAPGTDAEAGGTPAQRLVASAKQAHNTLLLLTYLYLFGVVEHELVYDVLDLLVARFDDSDVEMVLMVMQHAGFNLRSDSPARLRDLIVALQRKQREDASSSGEVTGVGGGDGRARREVMLSMVYDIKNNRQRAAAHQFADIVERGLKLRKWLHRYSAQAVDSQADRRLRVRWAYLTSPQRSRRWYIEGAAPLVPGQRRVGSSSEGDAATRAGAGHDMMASASPALLALAKRQRMSTPVRRMVFVAMMGADSCADAFQRLVRLNLKGTAERQIVHVLMDCAAQEATYNVFYSNLAVRMCQYHARFKFTLQLAFWDVFKKMGDMVTRSLYNLAKLLAHLIANFQLSLSVVKVVDFTSLKPAGALFFRTTFGDLVSATHDDQTIRAVFSRAGAGPDRQLVRDGVLVFLHSYMEAAVRRQGKAKGLSREQRVAAQVRLRLARKALEAVVVD